jgi:hypothetical protein
MNRCMVFGLQFTLLLAIAGMGILLTHFGAQLDIRLANAGYMIFGVCTGISMSWGWVNGGKIPRLTG